MFLQETIQRCSTCGELTPHSKRAVALPKLLALAALLAALGCFVWSAIGEVEAELILLGVLLCSIALFVLLRDRRKYWGIHCERCRGKELSEHNRTKIKLDGTVEVFVLS